MNRGQAKYFFYILIIVVLTVTACTPWRKAYLESVKGQATQDEITQKLGPPRITRTLDSGGQVWLYRYEGVDQYGSDCTEYILTFDTSKILRSHVRQGC